ncbi:protein-L-isoaspartate O-methyltransferase [Corallococcus sp. H22C18031201]|uniref:protein-L-isoaspartate(D-aspartate) O-methyltransferase n=1 Tax=Citreicoccus inhibens TaxID=2849499 RepID=UPI000E71E292|nr:protein-L-isoaspartate(D-aspartate) O-methyltransferase [Citreicoccus inhibens]MBU8897455.1 protein-L-isoaspartate(D-aspartate) O-methyltransferase [Citreicoccus inhibens]RJS16769.1 protein-L-isoaspartate O-methyltransferase [Corallococcus sp. H22C18031201]
MGDQERAEYLARQGIQDRRVLEAIAHLRRAEFVPEQERARAGADTPLSIGQGQTISQPYIVALMTQALRLEGHERVLEIGTGSGYQTAVLAQLCREVFTVELLPDLSRTAQGLLTRLGFQDIAYRVGDGTRGWPEEAPFDAILATAAPEEVPAALVAQLTRGGRMVIPVGPAYGSQELLRIHRGPPGTLPRVEHLLPVRFVPMVETTPL